MNTLKLISACFYMILLGSGCGPAPTKEDIFAAEIKGSAVKDINEQERKKLEDLGTTPFKELDAEDQADASRILVDQLASDPKKLGKQYCHMMAVLEEDEAKAQKIRTACIKKVESGSTAVKIENLKKFFNESGLSPAEISKAIKSAGEILGSDVLVKIKAGASEEENEKAQKKIEEIAKKSGFSAEELMKFSAGIFAKMFPTVGAKESEVHGGTTAGPLDEREMIESYKKELWSKVSEHFHLLPKLSKTERMAIKILPISALRNDARVNPYVEGFKTQSRAKGLSEKGQEEVINDVLGRIKKMI